MEERENILTAMAVRSALQLKDEEIAIQNGVVYLDRKVKFTKFMSKTFKIVH